MNFIFETQYTAETMTAMAKVLRKTIRKKKNRWAHILGWTGIVLGADSKNSIIYDAIF